MCLEFMSGERHAARRGYGPARRQSEDSGMKLSQVDLFKAIIVNAKAEQMTYDELLHASEYCRTLREIDYTVNMLASSASETKADIQSELKHLFPK